VTCPKCKLLLPRGDDEQKPLLLPIEKILIERGVICDYCHRDKHGKMRPDAGDLTLYEGGIQ